MIFKGCKIKPRVSRPYCDSWRTSVAVQQLLDSFVSWTWLYLFWITNAWNVLVLIIFKGSFCKVLFADIKAIDFFVSSDYKHKTWFLDRLIFAIWKFVWCPVVSGLFFLSEARFISTAEFPCVIESVFLLSLVWWIHGVADRLFVVSIWSAEYLWWCIVDAILNIGVHLALYLEESAAVFNCDF